MQFGFLFLKLQGRVQLAVFGECTGCYRGFRVSLGGWSGRGGGGLHLEVCSRCRIMILVLLPF